MWEYENLMQNDKEELDRLSGAGMTWLFILVVCANAHRGGTWTGWQGDDGFVRDVARIPLRHAAAGSSSMRAHNLGHQGS